MAGARRAAAAVDPTVPLYHMDAMQDAVDRVAAPARWAARVVSGFAIAALLLALIGITVSSPTLSAIDNASLEFASHLARNRRRSYYSRFVAECSPWASASSRASR
jgi:hypothetical protein